MRTLAVSFLFLIVGLTTVTYSQEFDVREFRADPTDLAAIRYPKRSVNDEPCAIVKVITNIQGMKFDSNLGIVDIVHQEEGYWLYIPPRERRIRIMAEGFLPLDVAMPEPAQQNRVYNLIVTSKGIAGNLDVLPVNVIVDNHPDAVLRINGEVFPLDQTISLPRGEQIIRIEKPGYRVIEQTADISETNTLFRFELEGINEEIITLRTNPPGATVYINNIRQPRTTIFQDFLFPGTYNVRFTLSEYADLETTVVVEESGENNFSFDLERITGILYLTTEPADASVLINQRDYAGENEILLAPGTYRMVIEKEGYQVHEERFVMERGGELSRSILLMARQGSLRFISGHPDIGFRLMDARGNVVNQWQGTTLIEGLRTGTYRYEGDLAGQGAISGEVIIREGQETRIEAGLTDEQLLIYDREQHRLALEEHRRSRQPQQEPRQEQQVQPRETAPAQKQTDWTSASLFRQYNYSTLNLSYMEMSLNTLNFEQNIAASGGISLSSTMFISYLAVNLGISFGSLSLNDEAVSHFGHDRVGVFSYYIGAGPKFRIWAFELFLLGGFEGAAVTFDGFESDDLTVGNAMGEFGLYFLPENWRIGLKATSSFALNIFDGYPPFSRHEVGLIFRF